MKGTVLACLMLAAAASAQPQSYGLDYAFDDREPRTRLEQVIADKLPSLVKVHGASGLATIDAFATRTIHMWRSINRWTNCLAASRSSRFARLRCTAPPTLRLATTPTRTPSGLAGDRTNTTECRVTSLRPPS